MSSWTSWLAGHAHKHTPAPGWNFLPQGFEFMAQLLAKLEAERGASHQVDLTEYQDAYRWVQKSDSERVRV